MIEDVLGPARSVLAVLEKEPGYQLQNQLRKRIQYFERNQQAEERLASSKFWRRELDYLLSMARDMRGLRDTSPGSLEDAEWVELLRELQKAIEKYKARTHGKKG